MLAVGLGLSAHSTHQAKSTNPRNYKVQSENDTQKGHTRHVQVSKCVYSMFESFYEDSNRQLLDGFLDFDNHIRVDKTSDIGLFDIQ